MAETKGTRAGEYKALAAELTDEQLEVRLWRSYIKRAWMLQEMDARIEAAKRGDEYIEGTKKDKVGKAIYLRYLPSLLEDEHRRTLPKIPTPRIEPRTDAARLVAPKITEFVDVLFSSKKARVRETAFELQFDDDRMGGAIAKTVWRTEHHYNTGLKASEQQVALEIDRARQENLNPENAVIGNNDLHQVHLMEHSEEADRLGMAHPSYEALVRHRDEHGANLLVISSERAVLERVPRDSYVCDPDVPFHQRTWEAEFESVRVKDLIEQGYQNVNIENCPPENPPGSDATEFAYEDLTVRIARIHDILNDKLLVISLEGPEEGWFLKKGDWTWGAIDIYIPLAFRKHKAGEILGLSTIQMCIPILEELAGVDADIRRHRETHADYKTVYAPGAGDKEFKAGLNNPNQRFVPGSPELVAGVKEISPPPIPDTLLQYRETLLGELRRITGEDAQNVAANTPSAQTATESSIRQASHDGRKAERQEIMGDFLERVATNFLMLYREFGTQATTVREVGPIGEIFGQLRPEEIPKDLDVFVDIRSEDGEVKAQKVDAWGRYIQFLQTGVYPSDWQKVGEDYGKSLGIPRPEQYRLNAPQGAPVGAMSMPGVPGTQPQLATA